MYNAHLLINLNEISMMTTKQLFFNNYLVNRLNKTLEGFFINQQENYAEN